MDLYIHGIFHNLMMIEVIILVYVREAMTRDEMCKCFPGKYLIDYLDDNEKLLLFEIVKRFIPENDVMPYDEHYIELAVKEYANGSSTSWEDIEWK